VDGGLGGRSFFGVSSPNPHRSPLSVGATARCGPPTRDPWRDPGLPAAPPTGSDSLFNASPHSRRACWRCRPRSAVQGNKEPLSGAVAASGAVTQTLSGERPAGLRTTRAELFEAKTAPAFRQGLVWRP